MLVLLIIILYIIGALFLFSLVTALDNLQDDFKSPTKRNIIIALTIINFITVGGFLFIILIILGDSIQW